MIWPNNIYLQQQIESDSSKKLSHIDYVQKNERKFVVAISNAIHDRTKSMY